MPLILSRPWPDEAWMTPDQLAEAGAAKAAKLAATPCDEPFCREGAMADIEESAWYDRYDRGMAGAVIAHRDHQHRRR
jgi:hypothetical protein